MQFKPKQESEISRFATLPDGDYPFTVLESKEQLSKSAKNAGRPMVALKLAVHADGRDQWVWDYFADWFSEWKLKHFCETTGRGAQYEAGSLDVKNDAAKGWTGWVSLVTEQDNTGKERNVVDDYVVKDAPGNSAPLPSMNVATKSTPTTPPPGAGDDVPF